MEIRRAHTDAEFADVRRLIHAYLDWLPFEVTFQDIEDELADLRSRYEPPAGAALLAIHDDRPVGVVALKDLEDGICEMKRLFVEPDSRGLRAGRLLAEAIVEEGRRLGYRAMRLDTVPHLMPQAHGMYVEMGFKEIPAYVFNPLEGVAFLELEL